MGLIIIIGIILRLHHCDLCIDCWHFHGKVRVSVLTRDAGTVQLSGYAE